MKGSIFKIENSRWLRILLGIVIVVLSTYPSIWAQGSTEQRLSRLEARVDTLYSLLKPPPDTALAANTSKNNDNLLLGITGPQGTMLDKEVFVINHNNQWKIPYWVAYYTSRALLDGTAKRTDDFRPDTQLPPDGRSELADYNHSGFDRGHNAPAADFKRTKTAMSTTFLLSNMSPQTPNLNRKIWERLESESRESVNSEGEGWLVTGNLFLNSDSQAVTPSNFIGDNNVAVPTHCFKAICLKSTSGNYYLYAFLIPNQRKQISGTPSDYMLTVDRLETISGFDFFPQLPDSIENSLEATIQNVWPR